MAVFEKRCNFLPHNVEFGPEIEPNVHLLASSSFNDALSTNQNVIDVSTFEEDGEFRHVIDIPTLFPVNRIKWWGEKVFFLYFSYIIKWWYAI